MTFPAEKKKSIFLEKGVFFFYLAMHFPAKKKTHLLQKNALSCRKMRFSGGQHIAGNRRKSQEGFRAQESRTLANFHKTVGSFLLTTELLCSQLYCGAFLLTIGVSPVTIGAFSLTIEAFLLTIGKCVFSAPEWTVSKEAQL